MAITIKPEDIDWGSVKIALSSASTTFTWSTTTSNSGTATTKDVEMSNADHQVHVVANEDTDEVQLECWSCPGFKIIQKFGKSPNINQVYQATLDHWNGA